MQEMRVWTLGQEDSLEEKTATHSSILVWENPWTEPDGLQSMGSQKHQTQLRWSHWCRAIWATVSLWILSWAERTKQRSDVSEGKPCHREGMNRLRRGQGGKPSTEGGLTERRSWTYGLIGKPGDTEGHLWKEWGGGRGRFYMKTKTWKGCEMFKGSCRTAVW